MGQKGQPELGEGLPGEITWAPALALDPLTLPEPLPHIRLLDSGFVQDEP